MTGVTRAIFHSTTAGASQACGPRGTAHPDPGHGAGRRVPPVGLPRRARQRRHRPRAQRHAPASRSTPSAPPARSTRSSSGSHDAAPPAGGRSSSASTPSRSRSKPADGFAIVAERRRGAIARLDSAGPGDLSRVPRRDPRSAPTAATATRSPTARTAGRASPSSMPTSRTTAPATTMAAFAMCPACQREYDDVGGPALPRAAECLSGVRPARSTCAPPTARRFDADDPIAAAGRARCATG